jgi:hypothetical protein
MFRSPSQFSPAGRVVADGVVTADAYVSEALDAPAISGPPVIREAAPEVRTIMNHFPCLNLTL